MKFVYGTALAVAFFMIGCITGSFMSKVSDDKLLCDTSGVAQYTPDDLPEDWKVTSLVEIRSCMKLEVLTPEGQQTINVVAIEQPE